MMSSLADAQLHFGRGWPQVEAWRITDTVAISAWSPARPFYALAFKKNFKKLSSFTTLTRFLLRAFALSERGPTVLLVGLVVASGHSDFW